MKKLWLGLFSAVVLALLFSGCGGGGGGGVTPPPAGDVARLFPISQGTTWVYDTSETQYTDFKFTGAVVTMEKRNLRAGPFSIPIVVPKGFLSPRQGTHTYESITDSALTGTDTSTIVGTYAGDPFPPGVTTTIEETHLQGTEKVKYVTKMDGQVIDQHEDQFDVEAWDRSYYTNDNGEVKWWGNQHKENTEWGTINPYNPPWLLFKGGATSWTVGHIEQDIEGAVFSADMVANLVGQETVTVPAGTFTCYKVVYKLINVKLENPPTGVQVTSYNLNMTTTVWLALDKGIVKSESKTTFNASFKEQESGVTGNVSMTSTSTQTLKQ